MNAPSKRPSLSLLHINIQGLNAKFLELSVLLSKTSSDIVCISEHWFLRDHLESFNLIGYKLVSYFSRTHYERGGTAMFVRDSYDVEEIKCTFNSIEKHCEFCICEVTAASKKIVCVCLYRSPSPVGNFDIFFSKLTEILHEIYSPKKLFVISADFNVHFERNSADVDSLCQLLLSYGLRPHINGITRPSSNAQLDNIFSNIDEACGSIYHTDISDHYAQIFSCSINGNHNHQNYAKRRHFTDQNIRVFCGYLDQESWTEVYNAPDATEKFDSFNNIFKYYFDLSFPITTSKIRPEKDWVTCQIKHYSKYLKDLYVEYQITKNPNTLLHYKQERKEYRLFLSTYQKNLNHRKVLNSNNKSKTLWKIFNSVTNKTKKGENIRLKTDKGAITKLPKDVANLFLNQFSLPNNNTSRTLPVNCHNYPSLFLRPVDGMEVFRIIMGFSNKFSSGLDEVPMLVLKRAAEMVASPLAEVFNSCFVEGVFPPILKRAKLVPVYKKGDRFSAGNYRPIALLPSVSKILERAICTRLTDHLDRNDILAEQQYGFRTGRSTERAIFDTLSVIYDKLDRGESVAGLFFDLSRAFDTIDHRIMQQVLSNCGVRGVALDLLVSFLSQRQQVVCIEQAGNKYYSNWSDVEQGVPQGSVLGPTLFLLYVNDLGVKLEAAPNSGHSLRRICQYADDTSAIVAANDFSTLSEVCRHTTKQMSGWCTDYCLTLNAQKTGLITFNKGVGVNQSLYVTLHHRTIPITDNVRFLGVVLDAGLTWMQHTKILRSKLASACALMRRLREVVSLESFRLYYHSNIQSVISYGIVFWGSSAFTMDVFRAQKRIVRCMLRLGPRVSCRTHFPALGILTIPSLYFLQLVMFVRRYSYLFSSNKDFYTCDMVITTRSRNELCIPAHSSSFYEKGPYYSAVKAYRNLPSHLKQITDDKLFKKAVTSYLIERCCYDLDFLS